MEIKGIQSWMKQDDWLEVYVAWKYDFDDNELVIKHKVSHHLDFLSAASHSPVTDTQLNEEMLAWEIAKWLHFQPSQSAGGRFYQLVLLFCLDFCGDFCDAWRGRDKCDATWHQESLVTSCNSLQSPTELSAHRPSGWSVFRALGRRH